MGVYHLHRSDLRLHSGLGGDGSPGREGTCGGESRHRGSQEGSDGKGELHFLFCAYRLRVEEIVLFRWRGDGGGCFVVLDLFA